MASQADRARETVHERDVKRRRRTTTEIRFEIEELYLLRKAGESVRAWCEGCGREVQMTTADEAASLAGVTTRTVYRWVEQGKIHFAETAEGRVLVCLNSLS